MSRWIKIAVLVVTAVVAGQLLLQRSRSVPVQASGESAPPLALPDLRGRTVDLASLRGKVVAVNFWASWCGPCHAEMPELAQVWRQHRDRCFEMLGVAEESAREDVLRLAPDIPYPVLLDERAEALSSWRVPGYPRTYVVDPSGKIRHVFEGAIGSRELEDAIRPLLPASCPARS
jgi:cytochrome c biogenesis protein CcmG/thiol:disulfide interchange protein DsbE